MVKHFFLSENGLECSTVYEHGECLTFLPFLILFRQCPFNNGDQIRNIGLGGNFFRTWGVGIFVLDPESGGRHFLHASLANNFLINVIKKLFSWKTIEFWNTKYELDSGRGWIFLCTQWGSLVDFFCARKGEDCYFFRIGHQIFPNTPPVLNSPSLI